LGIIKISDKTKKCQADSVLAFFSDLHFLINRVLLIFSAIISLHTAQTTNITIQKSNMPTLQHFFYC